MVVCRADMHTFAFADALQFVIYTEEFKTSKHRLDGFLQQHEFSHRWSITLFKVEDTEIIEYVLACK